MKPAISVRIVLPGETARRGEASAIDLLQAVDRLGSLQQAAQELGLSYRHAWGLLKHWEAGVGEALLHSVRGKGATLAPAGRRLVEAQAWLAAEAGPSIAAWDARLQALFPARAPSPARPRAAPAVLRVASIADDLLADWFAGVREVALAPGWCGAADALARLHDGQADLAGFGLSDLYTRGSLPHVTLRRWLHPGQVRLLQVAERREGLVMARSRPLPVRQLGAAVRAGLRLCNRPRSCASRWLLDLCLDRDRIPAAQVRGYDDLAASQAEAVDRLAAGQADMMWGTPGLAHRQGWQFIDLASQTLYLAGLPGAATQAAFQALGRELAGADFIALARRHEGHDATGAGRWLAVAEALPWHRGGTLHMQIDADEQDCASPAQSAGPGRAGRRS